MPYDDMSPSLSVTLNPGRYAPLSTARYDRSNLQTYRPYAETRKQIWIDYNEALGLLHHQEVLELCLTSLADQAQPSDDAAKNRIHETLEFARTSAAAMRRHVNELLSCIPPQERPPTAMSGAKAEEVFSTPELLEMILLAGLSTREKLEVMGVKRSWRDGVKGSTAVRRSLGLSVSHNSFFYTPFTTTQMCRWNGWHTVGQDQPGFHTFSTQMEQWPETDDGRAILSFNKVRLVITPSSDLTQVFGSRVQSMTICNPPIHHLRVKMQKQCHCAGYWTERKVTSVRSTSVLGFTVGEMQRKAREIEGRLPLCNDCGKKFGMRFCGAIILSPDDPTVRAHAQSMDDQLKDKRQWELKGGGGSDTDEPGIFMQSASSEADYEEVDDDPRVAAPWDPDYEDQRDSDYESVVVVEYRREDDNGVESQLAETGMREVDAEGQEGELHSEESEVDVSRSLEVGVPDEDDNDGWDFIYDSTTEKHHTSNDEGEDQAMEGGSEEGVTEDERDVEDFYT